MNKQVEKTSTLQNPHSFFLLVNWSCITCNCTLELKWLSFQTHATVCCLFGPSSDLLLSLLLQFVTLWHVLSPCSRPPWFDLPPPPYPPDGAAACETEPPVYEASTQASETPAVRSERVQVHSSNPTVRCAAAQLRTLSSASSSTEETLQL